MRDGVGVSTETQKHVVAEIQMIDELLKDNIGLLFTLDNKDLVREEDNSREDKTVGVAKWRRLISVYVRGTRLNACVCV